MKSGFLESLEKSPNKSWKKNKLSAKAEFNSNFESGDFRRKQFSVSQNW